MRLPGANRHTEISSFVMQVPKQCSFVLLEIQIEIRKRIESEGRGNKKFLAYDGLQDLPAPHSDVLLKHRLYNT